MARAGVWIGPAARDPRCGRVWTKDRHDQHGPCWDVSIGDYVRGTAILHAFAGPPASCIECGAYLTNKACPARLGFRDGTPDVLRAYDRIRQQRSTGLGYVETVVRVSGKVVPESGDGGPMVMADSLTLIGPSENRP